MVADALSFQVKEIVNGCLCCTLVGQLGSAIQELVETQAPDRIIIETSGSAYPAPLAWELRRYEPVISLDGIVTVGDVPRAQQSEHWIRASIPAHTCPA